MGLMPVAIGQERDFGKIKWQTREDGMITVICGLEQIKLNVPQGNTMVFIRKTSSATPSVVKIFTL